MSEAKSTFTDSVPLDKKGNGGPEVDDWAPGPELDGAESKVDDTYETSQSKHTYNPSEGLWPEYCDPLYRMPDVVEVRISQGGEEYFFPLAISKADPSGKPYLGGYRNKMTGRIYHHASTNTPTNVQRTVKDYSNLRSRETQTVETKTVSVQLQRESGTQMERVDLKLDNRDDRVLITRPYFTADELFVIRKNAVIVMQRYWRGYLARCRAAGIRRRNVEYKAAIEQERKAAEEAIHQKQVADMARRTNPQTNSDFAILYNELDAWRRAEVLKIKETLSDPDERRAAMEELLVNETRSLQALQILKSAAQKQLHTQQTAEMLTQMSQPLVWQLSRGEVAYVHTPETQKAKELLELYNELIAPIQNVEVRLDVLLRVKQVMSAAEFSHSSVGVVSADDALELLSLLDREADLLSRARPLKTMERLRLRSSNLFLQFLQSPEFNPRATDFTRLVSK